MKALDACRYFQQGDTSSPNVVLEYRCQYCRPLAATPRSFSHPIHPPLTPGPVQRSRGGGGNCPGSRHRSASVKIEQNYRIHGTKPVKINKLGHLKITAKYFLGV